MAVALTALCGPSVIWGLYMWIYSPQWTPLRITNHTQGSIIVIAEERTYGPVQPGSTKLAGRISSAGVYRFQVYNVGNPKHLVEDWCLEPSDVARCTRDGVLSVSVPMSNGPGHKTVLVNGGPISVPNYRGSPVGN